MRKSRQRKKRRKENMMEKIWKKMRVREVEDWGQRKKKRRRKRKSKEKEITVEEQQQKVGEGGSCVYA